MCHQTVSLVARVLEENGISTVVLCTARDIVEHVGVARIVHSDFPLGSPCGEPNNPAQQRDVLEFAFKLLETAFVPRTIAQSPFKWSKGEQWKSLVFTQEQPYQTPEAEQRWLKKKETYRKLKAEGRV